MGDWYEGWRHRINRTHTLGQMTHKGEDDQIAEVSTRNKGLSTPYTGKTGFEDQ